MGQGSPEFCEKLLSSSCHLKKNILLAPVLGRETYCPLRPPAAFTGLYSYLNDDVSICLWWFTFCTDVSFGVYQHCTSKHTSFGN